MIIETIKKLIHPSVGVVCPRCERPMTGHDENECARKMSRRYFFGIGAGAVAAVIIAPRAGTGSLFNPVSNVARQYQNDMVAFQKMMNQWHSERLELMVMQPEPTLIA